MDVFSTSCRVGFSEEVKNKEGMKMKHMILGFISSFPTATIIYLLLVLMTNLEFDWAWLVFAIVIDLADDFISNIGQ